MFVILKNKIIKEQTSQAIEKSEPIDFFKIELLEKSKEFIEKNRLKFSPGNICSTNQNSLVSMSDNLEASRLTYFKKCMKQIETTISPIIGKIFFIVKLILLKI